MSAAIPRAEPEPANRLVYITSDTIRVNHSEVINAVHNYIGAKLPSGLDTIESIRQEEDGFMLLIREQKHADQLVVKEEILLKGNHTGFVHLGIPGSTKLIIKDLPLFVVKDDIENALKKLGKVYYVKTDFISGDVKNGEFTALVVFKEEVPDDIIVTSYGRMYKGDVEIIWQIISTCKK